MSHILHLDDKEIYLAREHVRHVKTVADLVKNAWQQQTSTKQRRYEKVQ